jgi:proteic killer suppression protein
MIASFGDAGTEDLFNGKATARARSFPSEITKVAARKLDLINAAHVLDDLKVPPGNRLEALKGKLKGRHSIRINGQWRIVFRWADGNAHEVAITDYH